MDDPLRNNPLDTVVEKALMTLKVASSDLVLQLVATDILYKEILMRWTINLRSMLCVSLGECTLH